MTIAEELYPSLETIDRAWDFLRVCIAMNHDHQKDESLDEQLDGVLWGLACCLFFEVHRRYPTEEELVTVISDPRA